MKESGFQLPHGLVSFFRVKVHAFAQDRQVARLIGCAVEQLRKGHSEGIDVSAFIGLRKAVLLRRGIAASTEQAGILFCAVFGHTCRVKINQPNVPVRREEDVGGLDITMDNPFAVQEGKDGA